MRDEYSIAPGHVQHLRPAPQDDRRPPFSEDAEQAVLSAMLMDAGAVAEARAKLTPESFYRSAHRVIFAAALALADAGTRVDPLTLADYLDAHQELGAAGGKEYLGYLLDVVPTAANVGYHAAIVARFRDQRALIADLQAAQAAAWDRAVPPEQVAQDLVSRLLPVATPSGAEGFVPVRDDMYAVMEGIERRMHAGARGELVGIPSGFASIDEQTGGWRDGELVAFAGVPKSGKTLLLVNGADAQLRADMAVGIVSAEMRRHALIERLIAKRARVATTAIRNGRLNHDDFSRVSRVAAELAGAPLFLDETPAPQFREVVARCRALKLRHPGIRILYVDYLQLLHADDETRAEELRGISYGLAALAKELGVPVVVLAQLNDKAIEARADKRPTLADVQGSSGLRQAAHYLGLIYRPGMYEPRKVDTLEVDFAATRDVGVFQVQLEAEPQYMTLRALGTFEAPDAPRARATQGDLLHV